MRHRHTTPFEMCEYKFHVRVPMDCWRQWIRHRTANVNEYSTRYSLAINSAQETMPDEWRVQSGNNKQGSENFLDVSAGEKLSSQEKELHRLSRVIYEKRISEGVAREQARKDLPLSTYTEAYWKIDLHNLFHFLSLRLDPRAQHEIRVYARAIADILRDAVPIAYKAFEDYVLNSAQFSGPESDFISSHVWPMSREQVEKLIFGVFKNGRETAEFLDKLGYLKCFLREPTRE